MAFRQPVEVLFADVDMMGHVNNASYFTYFETARTVYFLTLKDVPRPWKASQLDFIVARASCEYKRGLRWGERGEVVVWPTQIGSTSFTVTYALVDEAKKLVAVGETVQVCFDYDKNAKKPIPTDLRRRLEEEMKAGPGRLVQGLLTATDRAAAPAPARPRKASA